MLMDLGAWLNGTLFAVGVYLAVHFADPEVAMQECNKRLAKHGLELMPRHEHERRQALMAEAARAAARTTGEPRDPGELN